jgi:hypothetical protein
VSTEGKKLNLIQEFFKAKTEFLTNGLIGESVVVANLWLFGTDPGILTSN